VPIPTMKDPKKLLDEAIDEAFAQNEAALPTATPVRKPINRLYRVSVGGNPVIGAVAAATATLSVLATFLTLLVSRRRTRSPRARFLFGKPTRHVGYGRYHLGRFGTAYIVYTYKLPQVRYHLPPITYKLPPIRVKLPLPQR
jgi:hypothetical protein